MRISNHRTRINEAMKTRYTFDATSGLLVDRNGEPLGRVVSMTVDDSPLEHATAERVGYGVRRSGLSSVLPSENLSEQRQPHTPRPTATQLEREAVHRVWDYWLQTTGKRQKLDSKRERIIRNALAVMRSTHECSLEDAEQLVKRALLGLSRSPWHNGANPDRKVYLEVRHALKGRGDESDDERIEKAISWAALHDAGSLHTDPAKVERWLEDVRYTLSQPHHPERERAADSYRWLVAAGFKVERLDRPPYARITR